MTHAKTKLLRDAIAAGSPFQKKFIETHSRDMAEDILDDFEAYIEYCMEKGEDIQSLADAYLGFTNVMSGEQFFFAREGKYRYSSLKEVEEVVYKNPGYMKMYMLGLALTLFLWPQHRIIRDFFKTELMHNEIGGQYLEVGPGHGMFFLRALQCGKFEKCTGIDISPSSIEYTRSLITAHSKEVDTGYELVCADFLTSDFGHLFNGIVIGEVLEHVETPELFIGRIGELATEGSFVFLSTCFNAAALDHIYNFENFDQLETMFTRAGLSIVKRLPIPYVGKTTEQCLKHRFPMNVAYILTK